MIISSVLVDGPRRKHRLGTIEELTVLCCLPWMSGHKPFTTTINFFHHHDVRAHSLFRLRKVKRQAIVRHPQTSDVTVTIFP